METRLDMPGTREDTTPRDVGQPEEENLVIENLTELAAAGAAGSCWATSADCAFWIPGRAGT